MGNENKKEVHSLEKEKQFLMSGKRHYKNKMDCLIGQKYISELPQ